MGKRGLACFQASCSSLARPGTGASTTALHADTQHFWPFGLNYDDENTPELFAAHVLMAHALCLDCEEYDPATDADLTKPSDEELRCYQARYSDLRDAFGLQPRLAGLREHYWQHGHHEGRIATLPTPQELLCYAAANNCECSQEVDAALQHWLECGQHEGRQLTPAADGGEEAGDGVDGAGAGGAYWKWNNKAEVFFSTSRHNLSADLSFPNPDELFGHFGSPEWPPIRLRAVGPESVYAPAAKVYCHREAGRTTASGASGIASSSADDVPARFYWKRADSPAVHWSDRSGSTVTFNSPDEYFAHRCANGEPADWSGISTID